MSPDFFLSLGSILKWVGLGLSPLLLFPILILITPGPLAKIGNAMSNTIDRVSGGFLFAAIASALVLLFAQLAVVVLRYAFGLAYSWLDEIVIYAFAAMFMLGAAAALRDDAHVRVDILRPRFGNAGRSIIELLGAYLFIFPICVLIFWAGESGLARSWRLLEGSRESDGLPILFLFKTLLPVFAALLMAQGLSEAIKAALMLRGKRPYPEPATHSDVEAI